MGRRQSPLPAIVLARCCPGPALASLKGCNGAVETVTFCFQFRDDSCCVHWGCSLSLFGFERLVEIVNERDQMGAAVLVVPELERQCD